MGRDIPGEIIGPHHCLRVLCTCHSSREVTTSSASIPIPRPLIPLDISPEKMFRRAKKNKKFKGGAVWICDGDDHNYGINASVVVDGSGHATTSYTRYTRYDDDLLPQTKFSDAKCEEGTKETEADLLKARKQVCQYIFYNIVE